MPLCVMIVNDCQRWWITVMGDGACCHDWNQERQPVRCQDAACMPRQHLLGTRTGKEEVQLVGGWCLVSASVGGFSFPLLACLCLPLGVSSCFLSFQFNLAVSLPLSCRVQYREQNTSISGVWTKRNGVSRSSHALSYRRRLRKRRPRLHRVPVDLAPTPVQFFIRVLLCFSC